MKKFIPIKAFKKGHMPWNKNLTMDDKRIQEWHKKGAETQKQLYADGKLVPWNKNIKIGFMSKNPEETKRRLSEAKKKERHPNWIDGRSKDINHRHAQEKKWRLENRERKYFLVERRRALKKNAEGSFSFNEWMELKKKFNYICPMCGEKEPFMNQRCHLLTIDHAIPLSRKGSNYISNIQPLCLECNVKKHTQIIFFEPKDLHLSKS